MNVFRRAFESTVENIDQYKREQRLNQASKEFRERIHTLLAEAKHPHELRESPVFNESVAMLRYIPGNPYTQLGISQRKFASKALERAKSHPEWSEDLVALHKRGRTALASIAGYIDKDIEEDLQSRVLPSDIETL